MKKIRNLKTSPTVLCLTFSPRLIGICFSSDITVLFHFLLYLGKTGTFILMICSSLACYSWKLPTLPLVVTFARLDFPFTMCVFLKVISCSQVWWYNPVISPIWGAEEGGLQFQVLPGHVERLCLTITHK